MNRERTTFRATALLLLAALLCAASSHAATVYVNKNAPGPTHDGASWATACLTVQQGIDAAASGKEVWVAAGTYKEHVDLKSGVALFGGFAGNETSRSQRDPTKYNTVLDGSTINAPIVVIASDATSNTVLDGFTIQNGSNAQQVKYAGTGGGVYVEGGTPIISGNVIRNCRVYVYPSRTGSSCGGGILVAGGTPLIAGNTITGNSAVNGGGIYAMGGLISENLIATNQAGPSYSNSGFGGGMFIVGPAIAIHNVIMGNSAPGVYGGGGGIACIDAVILDNVLQDNSGFVAMALECGGNSSVIRNVVTDAYSPNHTGEVAFGGGSFSSNVLVTRSGDGMYLGYASTGNDDGGEPIILNNTFVQIGPQYDSVLPIAFASMYVSGERPAIANNIVLGWQTVGYTSRSTGVAPSFDVNHNALFNNASNTISLPGAAQVGASGNISQDPLFVNAAGGDYRFQAGSPCIDAGNDAYVGLGDRDVAGAPRIYGAHVDIGAYEYGSPRYTVLDAAEVLRVAAGISIATPADVSHLDVFPEPSGETRITVADATLIAAWLLE